MTGHEQSGAPRPSGTDRVLWVIGGVVCLAMLVGVFRIAAGPESSPAAAREPERTALPPSAEPQPEEPQTRVDGEDPCGLPKANLSPSEACPEDGDPSGTVLLTDVDERPVARIAAGTPLDMVRTDGDPPQTIRRRPGHVDALACVKSGPHAGTVAWVKSTMVWGKGACK